MTDDFQNYSIPDYEEEETPAGFRYTMWRIVPQIMIMPTSGWRLAKENGPAPEIAVLRFLLPLSLLSGASVFFSLLYPREIDPLGADAGFTVLLVNAVIQFCSFFIGYFLALVFAKLLLPKGDRFLPSSPYGKLLVMAAIGSLAFFHIMFEVLPMLDSILVFLPLWTIFIIYKGMEISGIQEEKSLLAVGVICVVTVCAPTMIEWILLLFT